MIETVLFDLDNTLLDFDRAEHEALRQTLLHLCGYAPEEMLRRYNAINRAQWKLLEQGKLFLSDVACGWMCLNCGYLFQGTQAPKACPVCSPDQGFFIRLEMAPYGGLVERK